MNPAAAPAFYRKNHRNHPRFCRWFAAVLSTIAAAIAAEPARTAWIMSKPAPLGLERLSPDVHSVEIGEKYVVVRSSGVSLKYFGPLQPRPLPQETVREFVFRIPLHPEPETGRHARVPIDVIGAFVNGLPIYNQFETLSYKGANLWHYDAVASNDDGTLTVSGHSSAELTHPTAPGLMEQLIASGGRHSPLIGFALDGYPVYGPWAYVNADGSGGLRRTRSSYRLRSITRRHDWPDGTRLTPEQFGPDASATAPLGTFAEDYEYARGSGDLDEFNGRFTRTPEYPDGTYAYFLTTDEAGRLGYPYLIGPRFYGRVQVFWELQQDRSVWKKGTDRSVHQGAVKRGQCIPMGTEWSVPFFRIGKQRVELSASDWPIRAGVAIRFRLEAGDARSERIRDFEYVHERPIHLVVASADLVDFDHIHPELADDSYQVTHTFEHGGRYRIWADYSLPGEAPQVDKFDVNVEGPVRARRKLAAPGNLNQEAGSIVVTLEPAKPLRAAEDIPIKLKLTGPMDRLEPYLGAWAHVFVIGEDLRSFSHAHTMEAPTVTGGARVAIGEAPSLRMGLGRADENSSPAGEGGVHTHAADGPPPREIQIMTSFPSAGLYKLWLQLQEAGRVVTVPFVLQVGPARGLSAGTVADPGFVTTPLAQAQVGRGSGPIRIRVTQRGYEPSSVEIPANTPVTLAFTRESSPNCGSEVVFPSFGIRKALPLGQTVLVQLPAQPAGEIGFSCGLGMYRGMAVAR
jgi:hypothetical protein